MKHKALWIIIPILFLLITTLLIGYFFIWLPYQKAESFITYGDMEIIQQADGSAVLSWPKAQHKDRYLLQIFEENENGEKNYYLNTYTSEEQFLLPSLPNDVILTIHVYTAVDYKQLWNVKERLCELPLSVSAQIDIPQIKNLKISTDVNSKTITLSYDSSIASSAHLYLQALDLSWSEIKKTDSNILSLKLGSSNDLPIPKHDQTLNFRMLSSRKQPGLKIVGYFSSEFQIQREDLLGRDLNLRIKDEGHNVCTLSWDETKGETYCVQRLNSLNDTWETIAEIPCDGERAYTTVHMPAFETFTYRVMAVGGQLMEGKDYAALSDTKEQVTKQTPVFCTIWPTKDLPAYQTHRVTSEEIDTAKAGTAYCVLDEINGMFQIRLNGKLCYIESQYCLINLPEYLQDKCKYDITNSYSSLYMVHEFEIPEVTDVVTGGYKKVQLDSGDFLVPLLYPTAKLLLTAADDALNQGYILKIYDSFRPQMATREIYDLTEKIINENIPEAPFTEKKTLEELELPEQKKEIDPVTNEEVSIPLTYADIMVTEEYGLSNFLAKGGSMHNYGLALDLTIEDLTTGEELEMQTSMHDLSHYSVQKKNNDNADILKKIMTDAGFGYILSEWWHYQDNATRDGQDNSALWYGVSASCWMADNYGWRYRNDKGNYFQDCEVTINEVTYTFDAEGYVITE